MVDLAGRQVTAPGYDQGGIVDPLDGMVVGEHYSTQFFALLGALILRVEYNSRILEQIRAALAFHVRTSKNEYEPGEWPYHWDFNNYAVLTCYELVAGKLEIDERSAIRSCLLSWRENRHKAVNWVLMRAYNARLRHTLFRKSFDLLRYYRHLRYALGSQVGDGCLDDERRSSRPIQYHAYSAALLFKIYLLTGRKAVLRSFLLALKYLCRFFDPDGDFNYLGRGQEQIFGYACALYVLEAGKKVNPDNARHFEELSKRCWSYLSTFQMDNGSFPLVLNNKPNDRRYGWYDYHHSSVYNAFLGAWLAEAYMLRCTSEDFDFSGQVEFHEPKECDSNKLSGIVFYSNRHYFLCLAAGQPSKYLSDCGLVFQHLHIRGYGALISCPGGAGGPDGDLFAKRHCIRDDAMRNFSAPIARIGNRWIVPAGGRGEIEKRDGDEFRLIYSYISVMRVTRSLKCTNRMILIEDLIETDFDDPPVELRLINLPLISFNSTLDIRPGVFEIGGDRKIYVNWETDVHCVTGRETLMTAKGDVNNCFCRLSDNEIESNSRYSARILIKF